MVTKFKPGAGEQNGIQNLLWHQAGYFQVHLEMYLIFTDFKHYTWSRPTISESQSHH